MDKVILGFGDGSLKKQRFSTAPSLMHNHTLSRINLNQRVYDDLLVADAAENLNLDMQLRNSKIGGRFWYVM